MWNSSTISSIRTTIRALFAPAHELRCAGSLWRYLLKELRNRSEDAHEAGAFMLGTEKDGKRVVHDLVFYDELDTSAYASGVCILHGDAFSKLWALCREKGLTVVADAHLHPGGAFQSESDRTNPMVARPGHIAVIVPHFARPPVRMSQLGIFQYLGAHRWRNFSGVTAKRHFRIEAWR